MEFTDILVSTLHDTKNSLGFLNNIIEEEIGKLENSSDVFIRFSTLQYEIKRINSNLIRLMSLYKSEKSKLMMTVDLNSVNEMLEETVWEHDVFIAARGITYVVECPDNLYWVFDKNLVSGAVGGILNNVLRYSKGEIRIAAREDERGYLSITIHDDGEGYPEHLIRATEENLEAKKASCFDTGSTGLGLYFANMVANLHIKGARRGSIKLRNGNERKGGIFELLLP